jgi:prepilin-type N-terminal cleavage/methylation domain-containing protein
MTPTRERRERPHDSGFTIVETIIVVAVAGLILLIVLLAIPTLQRNSHNNQRRQDVQAVLAAVSRYKLNNSGSMPSGGSDFLKGIDLTAYDRDSIAYLTGGVGSATDEGINVYSEVPTVDARSESNDDQKTINVYNYRKCDTAGSGTSTNRGAGFGDVVALYAIETSDGTAPQCQQL